MTEGVSEGKYRPFGTPFLQQARAKHALGGRGILVPSGHRPGPTEAAAETEAPFGTPMGRKMSGEISFLVVGAFDGYPLRHDVIETGVGSFFPKGIGAFWESHFTCVVRDGG